MVVVDETWADTAGRTRPGGRGWADTFEQLGVHGALRRGGGWQGGEARGRQGVKAQLRQAG